MPLPIRKLTARSVNLGPYSRGIVLPAWWLKLNGTPTRFQLEVTLDSLTIRPQSQEGTEIKS
jgi:hypothetical protein